MHTAQMGGTGSEWGTQVGNNYHQVSHMSKRKYAQGLDITVYLRGGTCLY